MFIFHPHMVRNIGGAEKLTRHTFENCVTMFTLASVNHAQQGEFGWNCPQISPKQTSGSHTFSGKSLKVVFFLEKVRKWENNDISNKIVAYFRAEQHKLHNLKL